MGLTDGFIIPKYAHYVSDYINHTLEPGSKIAWLGQQQRDKYSNMFAGINAHIRVKNLEHHFYDIANDDAPPIKNRWDVHDSWEGKINGYDLVLGLRLAYLVQSSSGLTKNLKYAVQNNKRVVFDFNTGNLSTTGEGRLQQAWKKTSTNLIPHFPEQFPVAIDYRVTDEDHLLSVDMLTEAGLKLSDSRIIKDPIKGRYYVLTEIIEK